MLARYLTQVSEAKKKLTLGVLKINVAGDSDTERFDPEQPMQTSTLDGTNSLLGLSKLRVDESNSDEASEDEESDDPEEFEVASSTDNRSVYSRLDELRLARSARIAKAVLYRSDLEDV